MTKHIPNFITSLNLFSGCVAIVLAFQGEVQMASGFIILAAVFDFFDGFVARLLHAYSAIGKELDSLADVVSFGVAPASISHVLMRSYIQNDMSLFIVWFLSLIPFIIPVFSALRLAKFNIDERQTTSFIGLPTPANALFYISFAFLDTTISPLVFAVVIVGFSLALVSEIPMFSLKIKDYSIINNVIRYLFLLLALILICWVKMKSFIVIIPLYILCSICNNVITKNAEHDKI